MTTLTNFNNKWVVSGDNLGRILFWDPVTGAASRPALNYQNKAACREVVSNSQFVYAAFEDQSLVQYQLNEAGEWTSLQSEFVKQESNVKHIVATEDFVYTINAKQQLSRSSAKDVTQVIQTTDFSQLPADQRNIVSFALSQANNQIWVVNNLGNVFILTADEFTLVEAQKELRTSHKHGGMSMDASPDG